MIEREVRTAKQTTDAAPIIPGEADKIFAFAEILRKMEETDTRTVVPLLKKIEVNTALLKKFTGLRSPESATLVQGKAAPQSIPTAILSPPKEKATLVMPMATLRPVAKEKKGEPTQKAVPTPPPVAGVSTPTLPIPPLPPPMPMATLAPVAKEKKAAPAWEAVSALPPVVPQAESKRDNSGRFVGKSKSQEARAAQVDKDQKKGIPQKGVEVAGGKGKAVQTAGADVGVAGEVAGRAAGGPMYDAAMEIKGAVESMRGGLVGKVARNVGEKTGLLKKKEEPAVVAETTPVLPIPPLPPAMPMATLTPVAKEKKAGSAQKAGQAIPPVVPGKNEPLAAFDSNEKIFESLQSSEAGDEKRHDELIKAILKADKAGSKGATGKTGGGKGTAKRDAAERMGLPSVRETGPGSAGREKLRKLRNKQQFPLGGGGPKMPGGAAGAGGGMTGSLLSRFALPALAVAGAGAAGYGAGTLLNTGINKAGGAITGKKDWSLGGQVYDWTHGGDAATTFETGGKKTPAQAAATISSGKGDKGGKSYGSYQLASKEGEVGKYLQKSGYAKQFDGLQPGSKEFDAKWKQTAEADPKFAESQKQYAVDTKYNPQMKKLAESGIDLSGKGKAVQEMVLSTANQYGGNTSTIQKALKGKDAASMSEAQIISAVQDSKAANVDSQFKSSSPEVRAGVAKRIQDEKAYLLAADQREKQGAPARKSPDTQSANSATGGVAAKPAMPTQEAKRIEVAAKPTAATPAGPIYADAKAKQAEPAVVTSEARASAPAAGAISSETRRVDMAQGRGGLLAKKRAELAAMGAGSLETKPVAATSLAAPVTAQTEANAKQAVTSLATAVPPAQAPVTSLATSVVSRPPPPARIQPVAEARQKAFSDTGGGSSGAGAGSDGAAAAPGMEKLMAMMTKMMGGKEGGGGQQQIRTEFDDTMLTLMAYDRV